ncbi:hypothetical protein L6452_03898 [Arctium lappa]|uniref:Uncharacterized protein n=1 Tax=Arctium lappa TaxID=4217 RepID=A0ACB9FPQ8_ARCLA|nr:hypothetical protein L6452_03898 [Arctium lappa]
MTINPNYPTQPNTSATNGVMITSAAAMTINPNYATQPNTTATNGVMITGAAAMTTNPNYATQPNTTATNGVMITGAAAMTINPNYATQPNTTATNGVMITGAAAMTTNPNYPTQPNTTAINGGTILRGGPTANKSQSGIAEIMTANSHTANSSTATLPRSGQILSAAPNFITNPAAQSSWSSRTTDLAQYQPSQPLQNQPLRQQVLTQKVIQHPQTHSSMEQSNIIFGHQKNQNRLPSDQLRPYQRPMVNSQTGHLQNQQALWQQSNTSQLQQPQPQPQQQMVQPIQNFQQNQNNKMQLQFQQPSGSSNNLISEDRRQRFQGFAIGDHGQRKPQEQPQGYIATAMAAPSVFKAPSEFPTTAAWSEYALRQIFQMKDRFFTDLLVMQRNAKQFCIQGRDTAAAAKYESVKKFLEKMITFLTIPTVDMIPNNPERVHGYMNFIVNYLQSFRNKNGGVSSQHPQLLIHQPPQLQPSTGANVKLQYTPQQNLSQGVANLETNMLNFNQNFPSRRPQQPRMGPSSSVSSVSFPPGMDQRPANSLHTGSLTNVLSATQKSSSGLLTTTTANNFQSRQLNNQPAAVATAHQRLSSEKLKQPMQKVNDQLAMSPLGTSRMVNQFHSPPFSLTSSVVRPINSPINQHAAPAGRSPWNAVSSSRVDANNVLSPQSIARSPFLQLPASSTPSHAEKQLSSGVSSLSTAESKKPETPIMTVQSGYLGTMIKDKVPDTGAAPRTPTTSSMDAPSTEKSQESSQESNDPHLRLVQAVKSLSSKALSSSLNDICSAKKEMNSIPYYGEPTNPIAPYKEMEPNFLLEYDNEPTNLISPNLEDESSFLLEYENEPERNMKRKLSVTSVDSSSPDFSDLENFDRFVFEEWDMDSTGTSMNKRPKIECKNGAILEEIKEINGKLLETSLEVSEDNISIHGDYEGTIIRCLYRNVSFPELQSLMGGVSSEKKPEFVIELLVPVDYPASSPIVSNPRCNIQGSELPGMLFKEMVSRFERSVRELGEKMSIGDMARQWDACCRTVIMELAQQRGGGSLVSSYGRWEGCTN